MSTLVFDSSPVITLAMTNLFPTLVGIKAKFKGEFCIVPAVRKELVDTPMESRKYKFQALEIQRLINEGVITVCDDPALALLRDQLQDIANNIYKAKGVPIKIVHVGEMESLALAIRTRASALVVDERTTRKLIEEPSQLQDILQHKLHTRISCDKAKLAQFKKLVSTVKVLRSFELMIIAYELGLLQGYMPKGADAKRILLEAVLWGLKLDGCAVSEEEIEGIIVAESRR